MRFARRLSGLTKLLCAASLVALAGCATQPATPTPAATATPAKKLPVIDLDEKKAFPLDKHLESKDIAAGSMTNAQLFEAGAKLFHTPYNGLDGVGMKHTVGGAPVGRFSVGPAGGGQPIPVGAQSCGSCHAMPFATAAGLAHARVFFDADQDGKPPFAPRDATSVFGNGLLQLLAQEMTEQLLASRDAAASQAKAKPGTAVKQELEANGVDFGVVSATANAKGEVAFDVSQVRGVSPDLVVRPLGWKGNVPTLRVFSVAAGTFGMGMMGEEFVWRVADKLGDDPDGDGVTREFSVGDITAMTVYMAGQETPTPIAHLAELGLVAAPDAATTARINAGRDLFTKIGCTSCHVPEMRLKSTIFEEPTPAGGGNYFDKFLASKDPDYDPKRPVKFDLAKEAEVPRVETVAGGGALVRLYGDLKRHDMGRTLAEPVPTAPFVTELGPLMWDGKPALIGPSIFLTAELWGVGNTGPYLHDDRAGTLAEAIDMHGEDSPPPVGRPGRSEAQESRDAYIKLSSEEKNAVISFLKSLVTFADDSANK
ncbi:MAG: hypothetical protein ACRD2N_06920 [Vicinamibacterales bacterium]